MENPYCSCRLTRVRFPAGRQALDKSASAVASALVDMAEAAAADAKAAAAKVMVDVHDSPCSNYGLPCNMMALITSGCCQSR